MKSYSKKGKKSSRKMKKPSSKKSSVPKSSLPTKKHRRDPKRMIQEVPAYQQEPDTSQYIYGKNAVIEILKHEPKRVQKIYLAKDESMGDSRIRLIRGLAKDNSVTMQSVPIAKLTSLVDIEVRHKAQYVHQGVVALVTPEPLLTLDEWMQSVEPMIQESQKGLVIALDQVTDPHNIGAIIRTAEAMGALGVILPKHRTGVISPVASKAASGADRIIPIVQVGNLNTALDKLKEIGFWIMGSESAPDTPAFYQFDFATLPTVLVMGSEGKGLRVSVKSACDMLGAIPMFGETESLNVSAATAIMAYEISLQQNKE